ncbi:MAG: S8 family serine peptidase [Actinomycetota bacterium]
MRARGLPFLVVALLLAMLSPVLPASTDPPEVGAAAAVDVVTPSSEFVELLEADDQAQPVRMNKLRNSTLRRFKHFGDGEGIDVALIDTGVSPVAGLDDGRVLHGPDLSNEGHIPELAYLDSYGHGTHLAGIIAGDRAGNVGFAPEARIISVKVAGRDGITTVPQVVAAIDWVVEHRDRDGLNIRVLNLSLGLSGVPDHEGDLLSAAVERAWDAGIFVVVAAGNDGHTQDHLDSPAISPFILAVGASDTTSGRRATWTIPAWSATGNGERDPDLVAPGRSIASYRVPGSTIDQLAPGARFGDDLFLGSGTSQSAAVATGVAARLLSVLPEMTNEDLKATLSSGTRNIDAPRSRGGGGYLDGQRTINRIYMWVPQQLHRRAAGEGQGILAPSGATWSGGQWNGATWSGATWSGAVWSGGTWSGATWSGATWSGATWSGATWSGATWSGATWSGATWSGATWSGATWSGAGWDL